MKSSTKIKKFNADVYDTLELVAMEYGGIGRFQEFIRDINDIEIPVCVYGLACVTCNGVMYSDNPIEKELLKQGIYQYVNDNAVTSVYKRNNDNPFRISFNDWCKELNVVRGD